MDRPRSIDSLRDPAGALAGILGEALSAGQLTTKGHVAIELFDPATGRTIERHEADNYVNTVQLDEFAKAIQKLVWTYGYAGGSSTVTPNPYTGRDPRLMPTVRADTIAMWTDATAENTSDVYPFGEVIAWAHRWAQGSPSTRQGIVSPTLCTLSASAVKWVWEWGTPNGNGTFQSVGWRRLGALGNTGDVVVRDQPLFSRRPSSATGFTGDPSFSATMTDAVTNGAQFSLDPIYYDSGSGKLYFLVLSAAGRKLCSTPVTIDGNGDYTLGAVTDESAAAFAAGLGGDNISATTRHICGITRLGASGDWIGVGGTGVSNAARRPTVRRVTNAGSISYTNANAAAYPGEGVLVDVTYDGTNLWATGLSGSAFFVHRIDPATGTISATITAVGNAPAYFPAWSASNPPAGIEWDASLSCLWITTGAGYIMNIDTSGNWLGVLLGTNNLNFPTSPATLSGFYTGLTTLGAGSMDTDPFTSVWAGSTPYNQADAQTWTSGETSVSATMAGAGRGKLTRMDGDIFLSPVPSNQIDSSGFAKLAMQAFTQLPNFATRSLLGAPVTKTNTQGMRLAYTMTFT